MSTLLYGISNPARRKVTWPSPEQLKSDYDSGLSFRQLAIKYHVTRKAITRWLKAYRIELRTISETIRKTFKLFPEKLEYRQTPEYKELVSAGVLRANDLDPTINDRRGKSIKASYTPERKKRYSDWKTGTTLSPDGRAKVSAARKNFLSDDINREPLRDAWRDPEKRAARITKILESINRRPNKPEQKVIDAITEYNLPYKYTGDGSFIVAGLNPDFVNTNGRKVAVEVFGDYWHGEQAVRVAGTEEGRKAIFAEYGWDLVILWEKDINRLSKVGIAGILQETQ